MSQRRCNPSGPKDAKILIIGESPSLDEIRKGYPFCGASGHELTKMLAEVGINRSACRLIYTTPFQPYRNEISRFFLSKTEGEKHGHLVAGKWVTTELFQGLSELREEIERLQPETIIALGTVALWAVTGEWSISKWRGSCLTFNPIWKTEHTCRVIATYPPETILRSWAWRPLALFDLSAIHNPPPAEPHWDFRYGLTPEEVHNELDDILLDLSLNKPTWLSVDIETRERSFTDCIGIARSPTRSICIPFFRSSDYSFLFTLEEEADIILKIRSILTHPNARIIGQNYLYDAQYIARLWGFLRLPDHDTMYTQGVLYPGTPKDLGYLSSIYCTWHQYWKDDLSEAESTADDQQRWTYNNKDACRTFEIAMAQKKLVTKFGLENQFAYIHRILRPTFYTMRRGVLQDRKRLQEMFPPTLAEQQKFESMFYDIQQGAFPDIQLAKAKTASPWYRSSSQLKTLFYDHLQFPTQYNRKTRRPSTDDAALQAIKKKLPWTGPLMDALSAYRSISIFIQTYLNMKVDLDGRYHTSYNPVGTETFRFNSSEDAFGFGGNLQNTPGEK